MPASPSPSADPDQPAVYQFRVKAQLDGLWQDWFEGLRLTSEANGDTLLTGPVSDQAALHGLLRKVRDLRLPLLSVVRVAPEQADRPDIEP